jgi:hypothetical protein
VFLPTGAHTVVFSYRPAGFDLGLSFSGCGIVLALLLWFWPASNTPLAPDHAVLTWLPGWRLRWFIALLAIVLVSAIGIGPGGRPTLNSRWKNSFHSFTWGSGKEAMRVNRQ